MNHSNKPAKHRIELTSGNAEYIDQLYTAFKESPESVPTDWYHYFQGFEHGAETRQPEPNFPRQDIASGMERLMLAYRLLGHTFADTDPLKLKTRRRPPELTPEYYGLDKESLKHQLQVVSIDPQNPLPASEIITILEKVYCANVACEYLHIANSTQRRWIEQRLESTRGDWSAQLTNQERKDILSDLTAAEGLERFLHRRYTGQKRFSLEGSDTLIPLLDELVQGSGKRGITDVVLGMAHRGRLNVLVNLLGKAPADLFSEFEGPDKLNPDLGSGDVKYHQGFYSNIQTPGGLVHLSLAFNPSHLEIVGPVVQGGCRARQDQYEGESIDRVLPVLVHGDAAFTAQGVVTETFNLSKLPAYTTGGSIHIVLNNQIGFTTSKPSEARSTMYSTDVAKHIQAPVFHVNGDDPDAVLFVARMALDYRLNFHNDVVIDLVCYRRHGHNEADEPMLTQPGMYHVINQLPTVRSLYARQLEQEGLLRSDEAQAIEDNYVQSLEQGTVVVREFVQGSRSGYQANWERYLHARPDETVNTQVSQQEIEQLGQRVLALPEDFIVHRNAARVLQQRQEMLNEQRPLDWGMAETMAYATLINEGFAIRLTGQDTGRGTFSHRHAIFYHQKEDLDYVPLSNLSASQPAFDVINSPLSELAALAFEYGYATSSPETLVIWEAQFGDFGNCAQVVIDQFISSGYVKWGRLCPLTLFLPHGFEGQGPEHSSARLERFLQLSAELNIRVWVPTTPGQFFHLLRDQIKRDFRRPLIVMTPKSLLRHPLSKSELDVLSTGKLAVVLPESDIIPEQFVRRVILCSGKVFYDLLKTRRERNIEDIAIIRIEQLYPFPRRPLREILDDYTHAKEIVWCQEEPRNQGAWYQIQHHLRAIKHGEQILSFVGRSPSASPACGYAQIHEQQQKNLVNTALSENLIDDQGERLGDMDIHFLSND
jgi:2-oxoglutarate dehydrogenase E1 component